MTFRADRASSGETQVVVRDLLGGLDTTSPAHRVPPGASPDLLNVVLSGRSVRRRGGFVPLCDEVPGVSALRNVGRRVETRAQTSGGSTQATFISVLGSAHAGHRSVWNDADVRNGITLDLFVRIDDLSTSNGGNSNGAAAQIGRAHV